MCVGVFGFVLTSLMTACFFLHQMVSEGGVFVKVSSYTDQGESGADNGEVFQECSSKFCTYSFNFYQYKKIK